MTNLDTYLQSHGFELIGWNPQVYQSPRWDLFIFNNGHIALCCPVHRLPLHHANPDSEQEAIEWLADILDAQ